MRIKKNIFRRSEDPRMEFSFWQKNVTALQMYEMTLLKRLEKKGAANTQMK